MKGQLLINYHWWVAKTPAEPVRNDHREALEETAQTQIGGLLGQGETRGALADNIRLDEADGEEGIAYAGQWWVVLASRAF